MRAAVKLKVPAFLLSQRRKPGKSSLPPVRAAVKLKLPAFLLSQRRKAGKCEFAAHASGGKAAFGNSLDLTTGLRADRTDQVKLDNRFGPQQNTP
ncbi:hypothetical protein MRB53_009273 [Persea americana]|uniref:Uncharacterized protein n=1 Tax=Persea americana TaxID=3435 RepID=A0ACC2LNF9_PERAE|nr:hypothetical protein MRB53_009273 [Persea americana]